MSLIYLDNNATTPVDPRVLEAMLPFFNKQFGNPSSLHDFGIEAREAVEHARQEVADLIGCSSREIVFTSGATESDNLAILGIAEAYHQKGNHLITSNAEHKAVLNAFKKLESKGYEVTFLPVNQYGLISLDLLESTIRRDTILVSFMHANNEIGSIHPVEDIARISRQHDVIFHTDAAQTIGKLPINVHSMSIDLMSISAHKIYGPKGVGALYIRQKDRRISIAPQTYGGEQEKGIRSGTLNTPGIVGLGKACTIARQEMDEESKRTTQFRDLLCQGITSHLNGIQLNGHPHQRLPGNLNMSFEGVDGTVLMNEISRSLAVSSSSACTSDNVEPSHVLRAIGRDIALAKSTIRYGIGRFNTAEEMEMAIDATVHAVTRVRSKS